MNTRIIVACYKPSPVHQDSIYQPMQGGAALNKHKLNMDRDDRGENISINNPLYCENTYIYQAWKNWKDIDIIGLCHYRRYFDFHCQGRRFFPHTQFPFSSIDRFDYSIPEKLLKKIKSGCIILAKQNNYPRSLMDQYCISHNYKDFYLLKDYINETQNTAVRRSFFKIMIQGNTLYPNNLFIMNWKNFSDYCSWLFPILNDLEARVDTSDYEEHQALLFGYYSERLLNVWVDANQKKVIAKPFLFFDDTPEPYVSTFRYLIRSTFNKLGNYFTRPRSLY